MVARPMPRRSPTPRSIDAAVVVGLVAVDVAAQIVVAAGGRAPSASLSPLAVAVAAGAAALFWWRRSHPLLVLVAGVVAIAVASGVVSPGLLTEHAGIPLVVGIYSAGAWSERRTRAVVLVGCLGVLVFAALGHGPHTTLPQAGAVTLVLVALPFVAGQAARSRRAYIEEVERRLAEAERERDERAARAAADERRHIARELHDLVAHHVSLIGVQAGAARTALDRSPEASDSTRRALMAIEHSSRSAVGEMRQLLDVLRGEDGEAQLQPQPGLGLLATLVEGFEAAGLDVSVSVRGEPSALSPVQDLCCYRLVEEALTNVTRHSHAARASVWVDVRDEQVDVAVQDPGPPRSGTAGTGRGLVGLRERVALCGGVLSMGHSEQGFTVHASMPRMAT